MEIGRGNIAYGLTTAIEYASFGRKQVRVRSRSWTITNEVEHMDKLLDPVTPGELLKEEFLVPLGISQYRLAKETGIPAQRIGQIVLGRRSITADTDLRLCKFFGLTDGYWLRAQVAYDIEVAKRKLAPELEKIRPWAAGGQATCHIERDGSDK